MVDSNAFELKTTVTADDIDQLGHVNNVTYLRWVQDIAVAHWIARAPAADQKKLLWVVLRHEIDYLRPAFPGDELVVRTWVGHATKLRFERHTEFLRGDGEGQIAKARTIWCPVDAVTLRPVAVSLEVRAAFSMQ